MSNISQVEIQQSWLKEEQEGQPKRNHEQGRRDQKLSPFINIRENQELCCFVPYLNFIIVRNLSHF
jgi:hypothetical protein